MNLKARIERAMSAARQLAEGEATPIIREVVIEMPATEGEPVGLQVETDWSTPRLRVFEQFVRWIGCPEEG